MIELLKTIKAVGLRRMSQIYRGYRLGWMDIISGYYTTRTMQALFNVGFFDEVREKGTINIESFAASKHLEAGILRSLCDSLFSLSILKKDRLDYSLDSKGQLLVKVARGWFDGTYAYKEVFDSLEALLRKEKEYGKDICRSTDFVTKGYGEVEDLLFFPLAIDIITKNRFKKVLDLGCGDGTFLRSLCNSSSQVTGYGVDIAPDSIADGREKVNRAGFQDRIHLYVEDISRLEKVPDLLQGIDVVTIFFVLHELLFSGADCVIELLQTFKRLFPRVPLVVFEVSRPTPEQMRKRPGMAIQHFLYHDLTHQRPVSRGEWRDLFKRGGFSSVEERYLKFARTSIFTLN